MNHLGVYEMKFPIFRCLTGYYRCFAFLLIISTSLACHASAPQQAGYAHCSGKGFDGYTITDIIFADDAFYAMDIRGRIFSSKDGHEWVFVSENPELRLAKSIVWDGEYFLVVNGSSKIYRSSGAKSWEYVWEIPERATYRFSRSYNGSFYIATGIRRKAIFRSVDHGITWDKIHQSKDVSIADFDYRDGKFFYILERIMPGEQNDIAPEGWNLVDPIPRGMLDKEASRLRLGSLVMGDGRVLVASYDGNTILMSHGQKWKAITGKFSSDSFSRPNIKWTGKEFLLIADGGSAVWKSEQGEYWSKLGYNLDGARLYAVASNGDTRIITGAPPTSCRKSTTILVSIDGVNWENISERIDEAIKQADLKL